MSIKAIFYSKFDPQEGPKVIHQVPEDSILSSSDSPITTATDNTTTPSTTNPPLISFSAISRFLIPRQSLCGNLISLTPPPPTPQTPPILILSYPICLKSPDYPRNEFMFNFALVLSPPDTVDVTAYKSVVTKLAHLMRSLEEQSRFLSEDTSAPGTGKIYSLCEMLMEDLNNYCECMIPIDELNTLNIKLFPTLPNPPPVRAWHVPLFTVRIETMMDENWDLTMQRIIPFINGVNSVKKIALLADADLKLTKKCVKHLLYYGCLLLLDIFSFNAIYAPTAEFGDTIARDPDMQRECARYVNSAFAPGATEVALQSVDGNTLLTSRSEPEMEDWPLTAKGGIVDGVAIVQLYANLRQGLDVRGWYSQNTNMLANIDMRRFVTFGVIKGFLYRVHRYPYATGGEKKKKKKDDLRPGSKTGVRSNYKVKSSNVPPALHARSMSSELQIHEDDTPDSIAAARKRRQRYHNGRSDQQQDYSDENDSEDSNERITDDMLKPYLDGTHCFDEICTELEIGEKELEERLKREYSEEVVVICR